MAFEAEVRRVAEAVWRLAPGEIQPQHYSNDPVIRELDGLAKLQDVTHLLMVTVSRKLDKVKADVKKLKAAERVEQNTRPDAAISMWLITKYQLDAEHVRYARSNGVTCITLENFQSRFFNSRDYLSKRRTGAFGSARNLSDGRVTIPEDEYVELPLTLTHCNRSGIRLQDNHPQAVSIDDIVERLKKGEVIVMTAPFGSGKSLTTREIFLRLMWRHLRDQAVRAPLAINLREHWGQDYGDEILERHARSIGFTPKENTTIAWRAGLITLLIDGFDEVATQVVARRDQRDFLSQTRLHALRGARDLISKAPSGVGILICGRNHYFDNLSEMMHALGLTGRQYGHVKLDEFTDEQAKRFLEKRKLYLPLPDWLPRKPLILGYLAHHGLLEEVLKIDASRGFGYAWDEFLRRICERESMVERAAMEPDSVRHVLERLACLARATPSGTGPISGRDLEIAYRAETGLVPGEAVLMQLQRLPGLTERDQDPSTRSFLDEDMLAALQGGALARIILGDFRDIDDSGWFNGIGDKAVAMASHLLQVAGAEYQTVTATAVRFARQDGEMNRGRQLAADSIMIAMALARETGRIDFRGVFLEGAAFGRVDLEDLQVDNLTLRNCVIEEIILDDNGNQSSICIQDSMIQRVTGRASDKDLPRGMFERCSFQEFDDLSTNNAIIRGNQSASVKALLTVLRKIYLQPGSGRMLSALRRGVPNDVASRVDDVLQVLRSEGLISITGGVAHPIRRQQARAKEIVLAPNESHDPILAKVRQL